jgi:hypothetical protein
MRYTWDRREMYAGVWWVQLKKRDDMEDLSVGGRIILKRVLNRM